MGLKLQHSSFKCTVSGAVAFTEVMTSKPGDVWRVKSMQLKKTDHVCMLKGIFTFSNAAKGEPWDPSTR